MNAENINPFIQGAQNILNTVCMESTRLGKLFTKKPPYKSEKVAIIIGLTGNISGNVVYTMKYEAGCYIASKMMMGMPVETLDAMSASAISELTNMISGNVATLFSAHGVKVDITPPLFIPDTSACGFSFATFTSAVICIPLEFQNGHIFEIDLVVS